MGLTVEQRDLRDAVRGLFAKTDAAASSWPRLREEIGVAGLAIPERYGGAGAGLAESCVVMEELGTNLAPALCSVPSFSQLRPCWPPAMRRPAT